MLSTIRRFLDNRNNLLILVLVGILLMVIAIPVDTKKSGKEEENKGQITGVTQKENLGEEGDEGLWTDTKETEKRLNEILSKVDHAGKVEVMITYSSSEELVVEKDYPSYRKQITSEENGKTQNEHQYEYKESTVYTTNGEYTVPYVKKTFAPKVEGVLIVAEGAGNGTVNKNLTEAAQVLLGIEAHQVKVIKRKDG